MTLRVSDWQSESDLDIEERVIRWWKDSNYQFVSYGSDELKHRKKSKCCLFSCRYLLVLSISCIHYQQKRVLLNYHHHNQFFLLLIISCKPHRHKKRTHSICCFLGSCIGHQTIICPWVPSWLLSGIPKNTKQHQHHNMKHQHHHLVLGPILIIGLIVSDNINTIMNKSHTS